MLESRSSPDGREAWLNWAVRARDRVAYLGRLEATVRRDGSALIAYEFDPNYWGQGFAGEACRWLLGELAMAHGVREVRAEVDTRNTASIRLLERLSFERIAYKENADSFKGAPSHELTFRLRVAAEA
jgi:RimJ/RimL family protein N-acetyltransferase